MMRWDRIYLQKCADAGINISLYGRYVDDTNEVAEHTSDGETDEELAAKLQAIADTLMPGLS